tara:strand:+ start:238 stop:375 length:138 start_codon:yes stop_codon:yes gene_type:complete
MNKKIKDGLCIEFYENNQKKSEGTFKDGKPVGVYSLTGMKMDKRK